MEKRKRRERRQKEREQLGDAAPPPPPQRTLDNTREPDDTFVQPDDEELKNDTAVDEFAEFFLNKGMPKILITTSPHRNKRGKETMSFVEDLLKMFPNMTFRERRNYALKEIVDYCKAENYTDIMVVNEDAKQPNSLLLCHLPDGPTALFKLTSVILSQNIHNHAAPSDHYPEIILNRFSTRLGHSIGRMFAALVPAQPEFVGRRVMTFHNQRDFVFFRQHRYVFDSPEKARLQEIGPRFTLKLKYLQHGTFDSKFGEYEWLPKKELVTSRRRFFL
uniref:Brix domain-containing protein n=1 Tax=Arcella intermedia TaxID=1963864 RepID=A0A6B2L9U3_9EUKA